MIRPAVHLPASALARARDWVRGSAGGLVCLALAVGAGAGAGAVLFRYLILAFTRVFTGTDDYSGAGRVLYGLEDVADRLWRGPEWLRPAVGGVLLGLLLLGLPQLYGVGYPVLESAVRGNIVLGLLVALLVGKVVATSLTIAIGGSGGVFARGALAGVVAAPGDPARRRGHRAQGRNRTPRR